MVMEAMTGLIPDPHIPSLQVMKSWGCEGLGTSLGYSTTIQEDNDVSDVPSPQFDEAQEIIARCDTLKQTREVRRPDNICVYRPGIEPIHKSLGTRLGIE